MAHRGNNVKITVEEIKRRVLVGMPTGKMRLEKEIAEEEGMLATRDMPGDKAPGPDLFPVDIYKMCPVLRGALAEL